MSKTNTFYGFSLGNQTNENDDVSILTGENLSKLMEKINERSGPYWPTGEEIESLLLEFENPQSMINKKMELYKKFETVKEVYRDKYGDTEASCYVTNNPLGR